VDSTAVTRHDGQILGTETFHPKLPMKVTAYFFVGIAGLIGIWGLLTLFSSFLNLMEWPEKLIEKKYYLGVLLAWFDEIFKHPYVAVGIFTSIPIMGVGGFLWLLFQKYLGKGVIYQIICPMCKCKDVVEVYNSHTQGDLPITDVCTHCSSHLVIHDGQVYHTADCD